VYDPAVHRRIEHFTLSVSRVSVEGGGHSSLPSGSNLAMGFVAWGGEVWSRVPLRGWAGPCHVDGWMEAEHMPVNAQVDMRSVSISNALNHAMAFEGFVSTPATARAWTALTAPDQRYGSGRGFVAARDWPAASISIVDCTLTRVGRGTSQWLTSAVAFGVFALSPSGATVHIARNRFWGMQNKAISLMSSQGPTLTKFPQELSNFTIVNNVIHMIHNGTSGRARACAVVCVVLFAVCQQRLPSAPACALAAAVLLPCSSV
jgi:hypothetical protein